MNKNRSILIVEDEFISAEYLKVLLENEGYRVVNIVNTAEEAINQYKSIDPDLVLMDIMLKGNVSGSEAALKIKQYNSEAKIIFLTAYATDEMLDYAVEAEAYGYLMKPYREEEILATIKLAFIHLHEEQQPFSDEKIVLKNDFIYDMKHKRLMKNGMEVPLGKTKLRLVEILARNKNTSVSHEQLCAFVWGGQRSNETLRSLIHRIRGTIGNDMIRSINGVGYEIIG